MTIFIEIKKDSCISLFKHVMKGDKFFLEPFVFPSQRMELPSLPHSHIYLTKVPVVENTEALVAMEGAREVVPIAEAMGRGLDGYTVESLLQTFGGKVNGVTIAAGSSIEDEGIIFIAT